MRPMLPWLRTLVAIVLGFAAIDLMHLAGSRLFPAAYSPPGAGSWLPLFLVLMLLAGIAGTFVMVLVSRHRPWLHALVFLAIMLALDISALLDVFAGRDLWFKAFMLLSLPLQAWVGARLALFAWPQPERAR